MRQGVGTFVAQPKHTYDVLHLASFSEEMSRALEISSNSTVLMQALVLPPARVAHLLQLAAGALALQITRLRKVRQEPVLMETSFLPAALCPGLESADLAAHSLYALLENDHGLLAVAHTADHGMCTGQ